MCKHNGRRFTANFDLTSMLKVMDAVGTLEWAGELWIRLKNNIVQRLFAEAAWQEGFNNRRACMA